MRSTYADHAAFLRDDFDAQTYASQFLSSPAQPQEPGSVSENTLDVSNRVASVDTDMRVALSRLNVSITEVDQDIHGLVSANLSPDHLAFGAVPGARHQRRASS